MDIFEHQSTRKFLNGGAKMNLKVEKRGCDFIESEDENSIVSDMKSHRVVLQFIDKDGILVTGYACSGYKVRFLSKQGNRSSKPKIMHKEMLCFDLQYCTEDGCFAYKNDEIRKIIRENDYRYIQKDLLKVINMFSKEQYDGIEFMEVEM